MKALHCSKGLADVDSDNSSNQENDDRNFILSNKQKKVQRKRKRDDSLTTSQSTSKRVKKEKLVMDVSCLQKDRCKNAKRPESISNEKITDSRVDIALLPSSLLLARNIKLSQKTKQGQKKSKDSLEISVQYNIGLLALNVDENDIALCLSDKYEAFTYSISAKEPTTSSRRNPPNSCRSIQQLLEKCDIIFFCETNSTFVNKVLRKEILPNMRPKLSIVIFSLLDARDSILFSKIIEGSDGAFLEAPLFSPFPSPTKLDQFVYAAGNKALFDTVKHCLQELATKVIWFGAAGNVGKSNIIMSGLFGTMIASFSEALALADDAFTDNKIVIQLLGKILDALGFLPQVFQVAMKETSKGNSPLTLAPDHMEVIEEGMHHCSSMARWYKCPMPVFNAAHQVIINEKLSAAKSGKEKTSAVNSGKEKQSAVNSGKERQSAVNSGKETPPAVNSGKETPPAVNSCKENHLL